MRKEAEKYPVNMWFLGKTNPKLNPGSVFAMRYGEHRFLFGRIIRTDASGGGFPDSLLLYIYQEESNSITLIPDLSPHKLLIPPVLTNRTGWRQGYYRMVRTEELNSSDVLDQHCFRDSIKGIYVNEYGEKLTEEHHPCGFFGLGSYVTVDMRISEKLGLRKHIYEK